MPTRPKKRKFPRPRGGIRLDRGTVGWRPPRRSGTARRPPQEAHPPAPSQEPDQVVGSDGAAGAVDGLDPEPPVRGAREPPRCDISRLAPRFHGLSGQPTPRHRHEELHERGRPQGRPCKHRRDDTKRPHVATRTSSARSSRWLLLLHRGVGSPYQPELPSGRSFMPAPSEGPGHALR